MMDLTPYQQCLCRCMSGANPALCDGSQAFAEQGKKVKMTPHADEQVYAVVLDGCVLTDNHPKCDGVFLFCGRGRNVAALVELKRANIERAFEQLAFVRNERPEYRHLRDQLKAHCAGQVIEKAFIVSSAVCSLPVKEKLEEHYKIRVNSVLHSEATSKIPDSRNLI